MDGGARIYKSFCNKRPGSWNIKGLFLTKGNQTSLVRNLALFYVREDTASGLIGIMLLMCSSALWGQYRVFPHREFAQGAWSRVAAAT